MKKDSYLDFLETKKKARTYSGFEVADNDLNPLLFDFQKFCVKKALKVGRFALFENCGLGKTIQQLEWCLQVSKHIDKPTDFTHKILIKTCRSEYPHYVL